MITVLLVVVAAARWVSATAGPAAADQFVQDMKPALDRAMLELHTEDEEGKALVQAILDRKIQGRRHHP